MLKKERAPYQQLELWYVLELAGFRHDLPSVADIVRSGSLLETPNYLYVTPHDAYVITHTIFYLTDFADRKPVHLSATDVDHVSAVVEQLLPIFVRQAHWDLVGELLICFSSLSDRPSWMYDLAWAALRDGASEDGSVRLAGTRVHSRPVDGDPGSEFRARYHPTLVASMAGALCRTVHGAMV